MPRWLQDSIILAMEAFCGFLFPQSGSARRRYTYNNYGDRFIGSSWIITITWHKLRVSSHQNMATIKPKMESEKQLRGVQTNVRWIGLSKRSSDGFSEEVLDFEA